MKRTPLSSGLWAAAVAALLLLTAGGAQAQRRPNTTGLFLNAHLNATGITYDFSEFGGDADEAHSGGGLGIEVGYGFSPLVTVYLAVNGSGMEDEAGGSYALAHADLGVQFNFLARRRTVPYANLALGYRQANVAVDNRGQEVEFSGGGLTLGGGLKYFLSPTVALDGGLQVTLGTFTDVRVGNVTVANEIDVEAASVRLAAGLSWYPSRRRR